MSVPVSIDGYVPLEIPNLSTHGGPNKPMVATATTQLARYSHDSGRRHIGQPLDGAQGSDLRAAKGNDQATVTEQRVAITDIGRREEHVTTGLTTSIDEATTSKRLAMSGTFSIQFVVPSR